MQPFRIKTITAYHRLVGLPGPSHPLVSVIRLEDFKRPGGEVPARLVLDYYCISLKRGMTARMKYGQQESDFDEGVLFAMAPGQVWGLEFDPANTAMPSGWMMLIHPNFLWNTPLAKSIRGYAYFHYAVNEALYLSDREEQLMTGIVNCIAQECRNNLDKFSEPVIIAQLEVILTYADRFYQRQFLTRRASSHQLLARAEEVIDHYFSSNHPAKKGLPSTSDIAGQLNVSPGYLSELLKSLTGQSTQQHIHGKLIENAKEQLSTTSLSVSEIAFQLGFEHLASFSKLFKAKTNLSPAAFRASFHSPS